MKTTMSVSAGENAARPSSDSGIRLRMRQGYVLVSGIVALAVLFQVFAAGSGLFANPGWWPTHEMLGMMLSIGPLALLALGFAARLPARTLVLTGLLLVLMVLQPVLINLPVELKALHVVNALVIFGLTALLGQQVWSRMMRPSASGA